MSEPRWVKVKPKNRWEHLTWPEWLLKSTKRIIRWPDGSESAERVVSKKVQVEAHDHGHSYRQPQMRLGVVVRHRGLEFWVDIRDVEVWSSEL